MSLGSLFCDAILLMEPIDTVPHFLDPKTKYAAIRGVAAYFIYDVNLSCYEAR